MFKTLLKALCFSNVWISFAAWVNFHAYGLHFQHPTDFVNGCLVFFSTLFLYNVQRIWLLPYPPKGDERHAWINRNIKVLKVLAIIGFSVCMLLTFTLQVEQIILGGALVFVSMAYSFIPGKKPLRSIGLIKTFLVAIVWALVIFFFVPIDLIISASLTKEFLRFVLLVYLLTLLFEYRDKNTDTVATLARMLSEKQFALALTLLTSLLLILDVLNQQYALMAMDGLLLPIVIWMNFKKPKAIFYSFVVDGFLVLNALVLLFEVS